MNYIVPSGPTKEDDLSRLEKVLRLANAESKIILSGIGPDLDERLHIETKYGEQIKFNGTKGLDVHPELWVKMIEVKNNVFGVDTASITSKNNLENSFYGEICGEWTIVSRPIHLLKFKLIERKLRKNKKLAYRLELFYESSGYIGNLAKKTKDILHDSLSIIKEYIKKDN